MESKDALKLRFEPVAILWSDERPEGAIQFKEGRWGCVIRSFASAAKGKQKVFKQNFFQAYF
ncbi:MAG: hypothetical protein D6778_01270 [Nitrospirae bacterium]|nr:MAG: hypothetical protein D6778_01270 [Nitrospirota bacterium]